MSTAVRDVSSAFLNRATVSTTGRNAAAGGDFHKVWSSQMSKGATGGAVQDGGNQNQVKPKTEHSDTRNGRDDQQVSSDAGKEPEKLQETKAEDKTTEAVRQESTENTTETAESQDTPETELPEEQIRAMEVLGTAAVKLMEQIAEVFGISAEELQAVMDGLGLDRADLLDASKMGDLLLQLGGASDSYALITDEGLYENYRMIMEQLSQVLQEGAGEFGREPGELAGLLKEALEEAGISQEQDIPEEPVLTGEETGEETGFSTTEKASVSEGGLSADILQEEQNTKQEGGRQQRGAQPDARSDGGNQVNLFFQNLRTEQFRPELQQTQEISGNSPWSADTRQIMDQIMDYMKLTLNADTTSLEMQLHPASLGTLQIQIASRGGVVTANFIAQDEAVKAALESQMVQLREQFEEQGVKVEAIEVMVQTHEFEQNLEQGRGRNHQETEKKGRGRRISPGRAASLEAQEESAPEPDMTVTGGSTVSYTA